MVDPFGTATYEQNRWLGSDMGLPNYVPLSHTFIFTTNPDGTLAHTYSWGNAANTHTWHMDQSEDIVAAGMALKNPTLLAQRKKGCDELDPYIDQVYNEWVNDPAHIHRNYGIARNCKAEAGQMITEAIRRMNYDKAAMAATAASFLGPIMNSPGIPF